MYMLMLYLSKSNGFFVVHVQEKIRKNVSSLFKMVVVTTWIKKPTCKTHVFGTVYYRIQSIYYIDHSKQEKQQNKYRGENKIGEQADISLIEIIHQY